MDSYAAHMFTPLVQAEQEKQGVREKYEAAYRQRSTGPLDVAAREFIESRTSFYLATVSETGWPYIQHRGGSAGFLKVLGDAQIGFADYRGNKQMISKGNLNGDDRVSLFLMDYPQRARLKVIGRMRMVDVGEDQELAASVHLDGAPPAERVALIDVVALDWNCPKYIQPRFTQDEVAAMVAPHLAKRDRAIELLSDRLIALGGDPSAILKEDTADDSR